MNCDVRVAVHVVGILNSLITSLVLQIYLIYLHWYNKFTKSEILKYGPSLRDPCVKNEGLVFHGTG